MRSIPPSLLFLLCLGLVAIGRVHDDAQGQTPAPVAQAKPSLNIVGDYYDGGGYGGTGIKLSPNGRYVLVISSDTDASKESGGDYTLTNGLLVLSPRYSVTSTPEQSPRPHTVRTHVPLSAPKMRYLPVKWGDRLYLLRQGTGELAFCNAINLGEEPLPISSAFIHRFMMRDDDGKKPVTGKPQLSPQWSRYLLPRPVRGKIIRFQKGSPNGTAIINVGSANNIRVGMDLIDNRHDHYFTVTAVTAHQATLKVWGAEARIGDILSTRRTRSLLPH